MNRDVVVRYAATIRYEVACRDNGIHPNDGDGDLRVYVASVERYICEDQRQTRAMLDKYGSAGMYINYGNI